MQRRRRLVAWAPGSLAVRAWAGEQDFEQTFTAVAADRRSERLDAAQSVPAEFGGRQRSSGRSRPVGRPARAGRRARAAARCAGRATRPPSSPPGASRAGSAGGRQRTARALRWRTWSAPRPVGALTLALGARWDRWTQRRARGGARSARSRPSARAPRSSSRPTTAGRWTASAYRGFRAPTLNELYRAFRVGDVLTLANPDARGRAPRPAARPARCHRRRRAAHGARHPLLDGGRPARSPTSPSRSSRASSPASGENLGRTRSRGVEAGRRRPALGERWTLSAGYLLADARVDELPGRTATSKGCACRRCRATRPRFQLRFDDPRLASLGLQARWADEQFDDDQNRLRLGSFATVDAPRLAPARPRARRLRRGREPPRRALRGRPHAGAHARPAAPPPRRPPLRPPAGLTSRLSARCRGRRRGRGRRARRSPGRACSCRERRVADAGSRA